MLMKVYPPVGETILFKLAGVVDVADTGQVFYRDTIRQCKVLRKAVSTEAVYLVGRKFHLALGFVGAASGFGAAWIFWITIILRTVSPKDDAIVMTLAAAHKNSRISAALKE